MKYVTGEVLYTGADTRVVRGVHPETGARVVLKLAREDAPLQRTLEALRHEHTMLLELEVPGVIRTHGLVAHGQGLALVLEPWGDTSLDRVLERGPLPVDAALRLSVALSRALAEVHRRGIIHRDVKPQNVLSDQTLQEVRLIDFGIAIRRAYTAEAAPRAEALTGTLAYMAPEQTGRMDRVVDARADLYALGATLYHMLTGVVPFESTDALELIHAHIVKVPPAPHERAPEQRIPETVSAIVLKLMANSPDHRYQTIDGALFDLERAERGWIETGTVVPFALGVHDWEDRIRPPSRLVGREHESAMLEAAFDAACDGAAVVALVAGPSGLGKSALVQALRGRVRERQGILAQGKFDQLQRSTPYSALAQAFRSVVRRRLTDPAEVLAQWKQAWQEAAGANGRILVDLMPELVHLLVEPKPLVEVGPQEARTRFHSTVQRFVQATATAAHPLLLFIDDVQWADQASLSLLQELVTTPECRHLLLVMAYRDDEAGPSHPLHQLVAATRAKGVAVHQVTLSPLSEAALAAMVADVLDRPVGEASELSSLVKRKTDGSPFFVVQFLQILHEQRLLQRDPESGRWRWEEEAIERAGITDNVVTLLTQRLRALSPELQCVLQTAACIGDRFEPELVAHLEEQSTDELAATLAEAVHEGFLLHEGDAGHASYAFVHDRVQQAAYEMRSPEARLDAHLSIGRQLRARYGPACADGELFAMLYHRNRAAALLTDAAEKRDLIEQNLRAGKLAKASTAYVQAVGFLKVGQALLGDAGWAEAERLCFELHLGLAEVTSLSSERSEGERLFQLCLERARDDVERARVASVWLPLLLMVGQFAESVALGLTALAWLGCPLPRTPEAQRTLFEQLHHEIKPVLDRMTIADWRALPVSADHAHRLVSRLWEFIANSATYVAPTLSACSSMSIVVESLRQGITPSSALGCGYAAVPVAYMLGELSSSRRLVEATLASVEQHDAPSTSAVFSAAIAAMWSSPLARVKELFLQSERAAINECDTTFEGAGRRRIGYLDALSGVHLADIVPFMSKRAHMAAALDFHNVLSLLLTELRRNAPLDEEDSAAPRVLSEMDQQPRSSELTAFNATAMATWAGLHLGADGWAARTTIAAEPRWRTSHGHSCLLFFTLTLCITATHYLPTVSAEERPGWEEKLAFHGARLALWAEGSPETFRHMRLLVDAGRARLANQADEVERLYDEAIEDARKNGFVNDEALGLRLAGEHYLARGRARIARAYLTDAHDAYVRWGALAAAAQLRQRYPDVFPATPEAVLSNEARLARAGSMTSADLTTTAVDRLNSHLDVASALRAAQAIAGDRDLTSLIGRMLRLLAENAAAERAVLALVQGDTLRVQAELRVQPELLLLDLNELVEDSPRLPALLVRYVVRGEEPVVLGQANGDGRFEEDPYLRAHRPASVLAVPLMHQGRLSGVIYLEHSRVANAFPVARVELVTLLASQAATAVENAVLYAELASSNVRLEQQVQERTVELKAAKEAADAANRAKSDFLASMSHELRTPLGGILGYAQILERSPGVSSKDKGDARLIHRSGEHLLKLINDVLDLAKIEAGKMDLVLRDTRFTTVVQTVLGMCRVRADQKGISLVHEHVGPELGMVRTDEKQLTQVLLNLMGNAIKFTDQGGVTLRVEVLDELQENERTVRFLVKDTGPGIAPEHLARIFEAFEQVGDMKARAEGTGLGLTITKKIVEQMGSCIEVESQLGQGSVFSVTLRLCAVTEATAVRAEPSWQEITGYEGERRTILVVDDNPDNRALMRDMLVPMGFDLVEAESGERALTLAPERRPAFILMDLRMPGMDGYEAVRRLRQRPEIAKTVIVAFSASVTEAERHKSMSAGCNDFLLKPVQAEALFETLRRTLGLVWKRAQAQEQVGDSAPLGDAEIAELTPPPAQALARLLFLADRGRFLNLLDELRQLEQEQDPSLGPWFRQVRAMAQGFQLRRLRLLLRSQLDSTTRA